MGFQRTLSQRRKTFTRTPSQRRNVKLRETRQDGIFSHNLVFYAAPNNRCKVNEKPRNNIACLFNLRNVGKTLPGTDLGVLLSRQFM
jgi:hypothetical protein